MNKRTIGLLGLLALLLWSRRSSAAAAPSAPAGPDAAPGGRGTDMGSSTARGILTRYRDLFNSSGGPFPPGALAEYARVESGGRPRSIAAGGTGFREAGLFGAVVTQDGRDEVTRQDADPLDARGAVYLVQLAGQDILRRLATWFASNGYNAPRTAADWLVFLRLDRSIGHSGLLRVMEDAKRLPSPVESAIDALKAWHAAGRHFPIGVQTKAKVKLRVQRALDFPRVAAAVEPFGDTLQSPAPRAADVPRKPGGLFDLVDSAIRAGRRVA